MYVFDPSLDSLVIDSMAFNRSGMAAVSSGDKVFFAGGLITNQINGTTTSKVNIYNTSTQIWTSADLSIPRFIVQACSIDNKVFFAGGKTDVYTASNRIDIYDVSTNNWTYKDFPEEGGFLPIVFDSKVWFVRTGTNHVEIYDASNDSWSSRSLNSSVNANAAIVLNNKIYFTGNQKVQVYDINQDSWSTLELSEKKFLVPAVACNNKIAFIGGMTSWFVYSQTVEIYDPATDSWATRKMEKDLYYESLIF